MTGTVDDSTTVANLVVPADARHGPDSITALATAEEALADRKPKDGCDYSGRLLEAWILKLVTPDEALAEVPGGKG